MGGKNKGPEGAFNQQAANHGAPLPPNFLANNPALDAWNKTLGQKIEYTVWQVEGTGSFGRPGHFTMSTGLATTDNQRLVGAAFADGKIRPVNYVMAYDNVGGNPVITMGVRAEFGSQEDYDNYVKADDKRLSGNSPLHGVPFAGPGTYLTNVYRISSPGQYEKLDHYAYLKATDPDPDKARQLREEALRQFDPRGLGLPLELDKQVGMQDINTKWKIPTLDNHAIVNSMGVGQPVLNQVLKGVLGGLKLPGNN